MAVCCREYSGNQTVKFIMLCFNIHLLLKFYVLLKTSVKIKFEIVIIVLNN